MQTEARKQRRKIAPETGVKFCDNPAYFQDVVGRATMG